MEPALGSSTRTGPVGLAAVWLALSVIVLVSAAGLVGCAPDDPLDEIRRRQAAGDMAGSIEPLRALLASEDRRDDAEVLYLYGRALNATGTPTEALWALRAAMDDPEWRVPAGLTIAAGAYATRNFTVALDAIERVLEADPDDLDALLLRAQTHAARKLDYEQALADAERVLEARPGDIPAMEPKILALLGLDRIDEAAEAMEELGDAIRDTQLSREGLAWHCATMAIFANDGGHLELARERWAACLDEFPSSAEVVHKSIRFYDGLQEWDASLGVLRAAVADAPRAIGYRIALADRLRGRGDVDEAEALLLEATRFDEPDLQVSAWLGLVTHYQALDRYADAARASGEAVEVARAVGDVPPQLLVDHADALVMAGQLDAAVEIAETMTVAAYREIVLARARLQQGDPEGALAHFSEAFRVWPDNTIARYYAARAAEAIGDFDRAVEEYRYSIRLDPGATDARQRLARLRSAEGKPVLALRVLRTQAHEQPLDVEGDLLSIRLFAWAGHRDPLTALLDQLRHRPAVYPRAVAAAAEGLELRAGPALALRALDGVDDLPLTEPRNLDALRAFVEIAARGGRADDGLERVERALALHPGHADLHALHGRALVLAAAPDARVRAAYGRALELDPDHVRALVGLGELAARSDPVAASTWFERALALAPDDRDARLGAARVDRAAGRADAARVRLEAILVDAPFDLEVAQELVEIDRASGTAEVDLAPLEARIARFGHDSPERRRGDAAPSDTPRPATEQG